MLSHCTVEKMNTVKPKSGPHLGKPSTTWRPRLAVREIFTADHTWEGKTGGPVQGKPQLHSKFEASLEYMIYHLKRQNKTADAMAQWVKVLANGELHHFSSDLITHALAYAPRWSPSPVSGRLCVAGERTSVSVVVAQESVCPGRAATAVPLVRSSPEVGSQVQEG